MSENVRNWLLGGVALVLIVGVVWWWNTEPPKVSDNGYQYAMALVSICSRKDAEGLSAILEKIEQAESAGEIPSKDAQRLVSIAETAQSGNWDSASRSIRKLMEQQVVVVD